MTPDTPTTATAAIFEKYPRPWRYTGFDYRDATGKLILTDEIPPAVIVSAVNSAGADKQLLGELKNEVFNLRSALAAAREQNENLQGENNTLELAYENLKDTLYAVNSDLAAAREQHERATKQIKELEFFNSNMRMVIEAAQKIVDDKNEAKIAALSPSVRPASNAGEKPTQEQLRQKHGDPFDFAQACFRALGDPLTRDEVIKAIADYWNDWNRAAK